MGKAEGRMWMGAAGLGVGVLSLLALSRREELSAVASEVATEVQETVEEGMSWLTRVIARVSSHEGGYDALNLNTDGAGLSVGILQWAQAPGGLGILLQAQYKADPARFAVVYGPAWRELLVKTAEAGSLAPVNGAVLWKEPWVSIFRAAGNDPVFQRVQDQVATTGDHMKGALQVAQMLGVKTERSMALFYDTAVQQGPGGAKAVANKTLSKLSAAEPREVPVSLLLKTYAETAAGQFRRFTAPEPSAPGARLQWKEAGPGEWHRWSGQVNLYKDVLRRRTGIVSDPTLSDEPIT